MFEDGEDMIPLRGGLWRSEMSRRGRWEGVMKRRVGDVRVEDVVSRTSLKFITHFARTDDSVSYIEFKVQEQSYSSNTCRRNVWFVHSSRECQRAQVNTPCPSPCPLYKSSRLSLHQRRLSMR